MKAIKGFTFIEMSIMLIIIGLLVGMGTSLVESLLKQKKYRENEERLRINMESLVQYAMEHNGKLPNSNNCTQVLRYPKDVYGKYFYCVIPDEITKYSTCALKETNLKVNIHQPNNNNKITYTNVAFVIISGGKNYNIQTGINSPENPQIEIYKPLENNIDDYEEDIYRPEPYDDQVKFLLKEELKEKLFCNRSEQRLRILNDSLPDVTINPDNSTTPLLENIKIFAEGGVPFQLPYPAPKDKGYKWCIEKKEPSNSNLDFECGILPMPNPNLLTCDPEDSDTWPTCLKTISFKEIKKNDKGTHKLIFHVRDAKGNMIQKTLSLTVK